MRVQRVQKVQKVQREKVLRIDRPAAGGFLSLTAFQAEGCGLPLRGSPLSGCAGLPPQAGAE